MSQLSAWLHSPRARVAWRLVHIGLMLLVCLLAFGPGPRAPSAGHLDKLQHLLAFTVLGFAAHWAWAGSQPRHRAQTRGPTWPSLGGPAAAMLGYGVFIELVQAFIPTRSASLADVLADALGIVLGLSLALATGRWLGRHTPAVQAPGDDADQGRAH